MSINRLKRRPIIFDGFYDTAGAILHRTARRTAALERSRSLSVAQERLIRVLYLSQAVISYPIITRLWPHVVVSHNSDFVNVFLSAWEIDIAVHLGGRKNDRAHDGVVTLSELVLQPSPEVLQPQLSATSPSSAICPAQLRM